MTEEEFSQLQEAVTANPGKADARHGSAAVIQNRPLGNTGRAQPFEGLIDRESANESKLYNWGSISSVRARRIG